MARSQNNYSANDITKTHTKRIPGTVREIRLRRGNTGWLLRHLAAWFDRAVEDIEGGIYDDWGYAERPIRGSSTTLSNHASGTAIDLNATRHPLGVRGTFSTAETAAIRRRLTKYAGCIRWGGDYSGRPDEMHFEINRGRAAVAAVVAVLKTKRAVEDVVEKVGPIVDLTNVRAQARTNAPKRNAGVKRIQRRLNRKYKLGLKVDGYWGPKTSDGWLTHERGMHIKKPNAVPHMHSLRLLFKGTGVHVRK